MSDWRSIETAPLDGSYVRVRGGNARREQDAYFDAVCDAWFGEDYNPDGWGPGPADDVLFPAEWRPLTDRATVAA